MPGLACCYQHAGFCAQVCVAMRLWTVWLLSIALAKKGKHEVVSLTDGEPNVGKNEKALNQTLNSTRFWVVNFNSLRPTCKSCADLAVAVQKAAKKLKKRGVRCGMIDADLSVNLGATARNNVTSIPTLVFFRGGIALSKLEGNQSAFSIDQWVKAVAGPEVEVFDTQEAFNTAVKKRKTSETMFAATGGPGLQELLDLVALKGHRDGWGSRIRYLFWSDGGTGMPFAAVYRGVNEMEHFDVSGKVSSEMMEEFLRDNSLPLFGQATADDLANVFGSGTKGNVFVCFDPETFDTQAPAAKMSLRYSRIFYKAAKKWRGYGFSYLNGRDPVGMLLNIDCKEDWLSKLREVKRKLGTESADAQLESQALAAVEAGHAAVEQLCQAWSRQLNTAATVAGSHGVARDGTWQALLRSRAVETLLEGSCRHAQGQPLGQFDGSALRLLMARVLPDDHAALGQELVTVLSGERGDLASEDHTQFAAAMLAGGKVDWQSEANFAEQCELKKKCETLRQEMQKLGERHGEALDRPARVQISAELLGLYEALHQSLEEAECQSTSTAEARHQGFTRLLADIEAHAASLEGSEGVGQRQRCLQEELRQAHDLLAEELSQIDEKRAAADRQIERLETQKLQIRQRLQGLDDKLHAAREAQRTCLAERDGRRAKVTEVEAQFHQRLQGVEQQGLQARKEVAAAEKVREAAVQAESLTSQSLKAGAEELAAKASQFDGHLLNVLLDHVSQEERRIQQIAAEAEECAQIVQRHKAEIELLQVMDRPAQSVLSSLEHKRLCQTASGADAALKACAGFVRDFGPFLQQDANAQARLRKLEADHAQVLRKLAPCRAFIGGAAEASPQSSNSPRFAAQPPHSPGYPEGQTNLQMPSQASTMPGQGPDQLHTQYQLHSPRLQQLQQAQQPAQPPAAQLMQQSVLAQSQTAAQQSLPQAAQPPAQYSVQQAAQLPTQQAAQQAAQKLAPAQQAAQPPTQQPAQEPMQRPAQQSAPQPTQPPVQTPAQQPAPQPTQQPVQTPAQQAAPQPTQPAVQTSAQQAASPPAQQPAQQAAPQPTQPPVQTPAQQAASPPAQQPAQQAAPQPTQPPVQTPAQQAASPPAQQPAQQAAPQPTQPPVQTPAQQAASPPAQQPAQQAAPQPTQPPVQTPAQQAASPPAQQPVQTPAQTPAQQAAPQPTQPPVQTSAQQAASPPAQHPAQQAAPQPTQPPVQTPAQQAASPPAQQPVQAPGPAH
ncbi:unnamed protein product [Effrenium voratum]|uniref:Thioredoxin domain-containing protein n=1 Tax=Effrenium voratum TaxID=2562239 RepID=A0AA36N4Q3_9DINO|nr:unnamed protein product [Effrenium voratum]